MACYATFSRIVWWVTPQDTLQIRQLWCPPRFVALSFILPCLFSAFVQLLGASTVGAAYASRTSTASLRQTGYIALKIGLGMQLVVFGTFAIVGIRFLFLSRRWTDRSMPYTPRPGAPWRWLNWSIQLVATVITVSWVITYRTMETTYQNDQARAIYRVADLLDAGGDEPGYLSRYEWPFWVCDFLPMLGTHSRIILAIKLC